MWYAVPGSTTVWPLDEREPPINRTMTIAAIHQKPSPAWVGPRIETEFTEKGDVGMDESVGRSPHTRSLPESPH